MHRSWIVPHTRPGSAAASVRLVCFPYAGGNAAVYRTWPDGLPPEIEVAAVQLPGRGGRFKEMPLARVEEVVPPLSEALLPQMEEVPVVFFGHSMGALLAFEVARQLRRTGHRLPVHLFVSGRRSPHLPNPDPTVHLRSDAALICELRRYGGTPEVVLADERLMALFLPLLRADLAVDETHVYTPEPPFPFPISACAGTKDGHVDPDGLAAWAVHTDARFEMRHFLGDHFYLKEHQAELLRWLATALGHGIL